MGPNREPGNRPIHWCLTKEQRQCSEAEIVFSTNGPETIGHRYAKNECRRQTLYPLQKLAPNES